MDERHEAVLLAHVHHPPSLAPDKVTIISILIIIIILIIINIINIIIIIIISPVQVGRVDSGQTHGLV